MRLVGQVVLTNDNAQWGVQTQGVSNESIAKGTMGRTGGEKTRDLSYECKGRGLGLRGMGWRAVTCVLGSGEIIIITSIT